MERQLEKLSPDYKADEEVLGTTMLVAVVAEGFIGRLLGNDAILGYLSRNYGDLVGELSAVIEAVASEAPQLATGYSGPGASSASPRSIARPAVRVSRVPDCRACASPAPAEQSERHHQRRLACDRCQVTALCLLARRTFGNLVHNITTVLPSHRRQG